MMLKANQLRRSVNGDLVVTTLFGMNNPLNLKFWNISKSRFEHNVLYTCELSDVNACKRW